jgi:hypothetical protein
VGNRPIWARRSIPADTCVQFHRPLRIPSFSERFPPARCDFRDSRAKSSGRSAEFVAGCSLIDAVLFEDGTYEGAEAGAAILEATHAGREQQEQRIADLIQKELENADGDDEANIRFVYSHVTALSAEPEPWLVSGVLARIPNLTDEQKELIPRNVSDGLRISKYTFLGNLHLYRIERQRGCLPVISLQDWWEKTNGQRDSSGVLS